MLPDIEKSWVFIFVFVSLANLGNSLEDSAYLDSNFLRTSRGLGILRLGRRTMNMNKRLRILRMGRAMQGAHKDMYGDTSDDSDLYRRQTIWPRIGKDLESQYQYEAEPFMPGGGRPPPRVGKEISGDIKQLLNYAEKLLQNDKFNSRQDRALGDNQLPRLGQMTQKRSYVPPQNTYKRSIKKRSIKERKRASVSLPRLSMKFDNKRGGFQLPRLSGGYGQKKRGRFLTPRLGGEKRGRFLSPRLGQAKRGSFLTPRLGEDKRARFINPRLGGAELGVKRSSNEKYLCGNHGNSPAKDNTDRSVLYPRIGRIPNISNKLKSFVKKWKILRMGKKSTYEKS